MKELQKYHMLKYSETDYTRHYFYDTIIAVIMALFGIAAIYVFGLYFSFTRVLLIYIPIVLMIAVIRGLYASLLASLLASAAIVLFFIPEPFKPTLLNSEKWLSLLLLSFVAGVAGRLTSKSQRVIEESKREACEMSLLYQLLKAIENTKHPEEQLQIIADTILAVFHPWGVAMCTFLIITSEEKLLLQANAPLAEHTTESLLIEEESAILATIRNKQAQILHDAQHVSHPLGNHYVRFPFKGATEGRYIHIIPLMRGQRVIGALRLVAEGKSQLFVNRGKGPIADFFQTFLDQAMSAIERAQLQAEKLHAETWQQTDALRASLIHLVSHDLRTPLSTIKIAASTLYEVAIDQGDTTLKESSYTIQQEADRLNHLVGNLLDMSRIEGNALRLDTVLFPMDTLIYETLEQMEPLLQNRVLIDIPENLPPVEIEPTRIKQVLRNLLENAVRYTPATSPIEINAHVTNDYMIIRVMDHGPGIDPSDREHVFDKFYCVKKHRYNTLLPPGAGLGLAICRGLIDAHGGQIQTSNRPEGGAIFSFTLPVKQGEAYDQGKYEDSNR